MSKRFMSDRHQNDRRYRSDHSTNRNEFEENDHHFHYSENGATSDETLALDKKQLKLERRLKERQLSDFRKQQREKKSLGLA